MQGQRPCLRYAERGTLLCFIKRRRGSKGEPSPGVPPYFTLVRARRYFGRRSLACPAIRPHFFGACPKKRCRAAKEKRFLPRRLHHSRERYCLGCLYSSSPDLGRGWCLSGDCTGAPFSWVEVSSTYCPFHPISLLLRKETGWSPKETRLRVPPRELLGPARLSHGLEAPTSQPTASS